MIAREIAEDPKVLIAAQPTRGLDVGAIEFVHRRLIEQRDAGRGVLLVSLELEEIRSLSDRVLVMYDGRVVAELAPEASEEEFGVAMLGGGGERPRVSEGEGEGTHTVGSQLSGYLRAGGIVTPLATALIAFFIGGLVVAFTGSNPFTVYKAIFEGSGLNWLLPWISPEDRTLAALNLQQTLILTTPLILTGMAVAYAFRAGLFNIGGQGQYLAGLFVGVWVGSSFAGLPGVAPHPRRAGGRDAGRSAVGRDRRLPQGDHRRERGDQHDHAQLRVLWVGVWAFGLGGPLHSDSPSNESIPISDAVVGGRAAAGLLGRPGAAGPARRDLHRRAALDRVLGPAEPVGRGLRGARRRLQPRRRGVRRDPRRPDLREGDADCGAFAGLGGVLDILGWQFAVATNDIQNASVVGAGFIGIAVALLGRNTTSGVLFSALLFGALQTGPRCATSTRRSSRPSSPPTSR